MCWLIILLIFSSCSRPSRGSCRCCCCRRSYRRRPLSPRTFWRSCPCRWRATSAGSNRCLRSWLVVATTSPWSALSRWPIGAFRTIPTWTWRLKKVFPVSIYLQYNLLLYSVSPLPPPKWRLSMNRTFFFYWIKFPTTTVILITKRVGHLQTCNGWAEMTVP